MRIQRATALAAGMTAFLAAPAWTGELAGVTLPEQTQVEAVAGRETAEPEPQGGSPRSWLMRGFAESGGWNLI